MIQEDIPPEPQKTNPISTESQIINIQNIKEEKKGKPDPKDSIWYNRFSFWLSIGLFFSIAAALLSLLNKRIIYLIPLGPVAGICLWFVRRLIKRFSGNDSLFK